MDFNFAVNNFPAELLCMIALYAPVLRCVNRYCHHNIPNAGLRAFANALSPVMDFLPSRDDVLNGEWWLEKVHDTLKRSGVQLVGCYRSGNVVISGRRFFSSVCVPSRVAIDVCVAPHLRDAAHSELRRVRHPAHPDFARLYDAGYPFLVDTATAQSVGYEGIRALRRDRFWPSVADEKTP